MKRRSDPAIELRKRFLCVFSFFLYFFEWREERKNSADKWININWNWEPRRDSRLSARNWDRIIIIISSRYIVNRHCGLWKPSIWYSHLSAQTNMSHGKFCVFIFLFLFFFGFFIVFVFAILLFRSVSVFIDFWVQRKFYFIFDGLCDCKCDRVFVYVWLRTRQRTSKYVQWNWP